MLALFALALAAPTLVAAGDACPAPTITLAGVQSTHTDGDVRHYDVAITVTNTGSAEPSSELQSVEIWQDGTKVDQKGVPPLKAGAKTTVRYDFQRSGEARDNSTHLRLQLTGHDAHGTCAFQAPVYRLDV